MDVSFSIAAPFAFVKRIVPCCSQQNPVPYLVQMKQNIDAPLNRKSKQWHNAHLPDRRGSMVACAQSRYRPSDLRDYVAGDCPGRSICVPYHSGSPEGECSCSHTYEMFQGMIDGTGQLTCHLSPSTKAIFSAFAIMIAIGVVVVVVNGVPVLHSLSGRRAGVDLFLTTQIMTILSSLAMMSHHIIRLFSMTNMSGGDSWETLNRGYFVSLAVYFFMLVFANIFFLLTLLEVLRGFHADMAGSKLKRVGVSVTFAILLFFIYILCAFLDVITLIQPITVFSALSSWLLFHLVYSRILAATRANKTVDSSTDRLEAVLANGSRFVTRNMVILVIFLISTVLEVCFAAVGKRSDLQTSKLYLGPLRATVRIISHVVGVLNILILSLFLRSARKIHTASMLRPSTSRVRDSLHALLSLISGFSLELTTLKP